MVDPALPLCHSHVQYHYMYIACTMIFHEEYAGTQYGVSLLQQISDRIN